MPSGPLTIRMSIGPRAPARPHQAQRDAAAGCAPSPSEPPRHCHRAAHRSAQRAFRWQLSSGALSRRGRVRCPHCGDSRARFPDRGATNRRCDSESSHWRPAQKSPCRRQLPEERSDAERMHAQKPTTSHRPHCFSVYERTHAPSKILVCQPRETKVNEELIFCPENSTPMQALVNASFATKSDGWFNPNFRK